MKQLISPNLNTTDLSGWCLRFVGNSYNTKPRPFEHATAAWNGAKFKHTDALPNVAVPIYYYWYGTIDKVTKNWGDVAIWVPGRGVFGTPPAGSGKSNRWDATPEARAKWLGGSARYLGWSEDINGIRVVEPLPQGGSNVILTEEAVKTLYRRLFSREGDAGGVRNYTGKTLDFALNDMLGSQEFKRIHTVETVKEVIKEVQVGTPANPKAEALLKAVQEAVK